MFYGRDTGKNRPAKNQHCRFVDAERTKEEKNKISADRNGPGDSLCKKAHTANLDVLYCLQKKIASIIPRERKPSPLP